MFSLNVQNQKSWLKSIFFMHAFSQHIIFFVFVSILNSLCCQLRKSFSDRTKIHCWAHPRKNLSSTKICRPFSIKLFTKCSLFNFFHRLFLPRFEAYSYWICVHTIIGWEAVNGWRLDITYVQINRQTFVLFIIRYLEKYRHQKMNRVCILLGFNFGLKSNAKWNERNSVT